MRNEASVQDAATGEEIANNMRQQSDELLRAEAKLCVLQAQITGTPARRLRCCRQARAIWGSISTQLTRVWCITMSVG